jgi:stage III sporulation protein AC
VTTSENTSFVDSSSSTCGLCYFLSLFKGEGRREMPDINIIFKIAGVGILISVLNIILKQAEKEEQAQLLTLAGVVVVFLMVIQLIYRLFQDVRAVFGL